MISSSVPGSSRFSPSDESPRITTTSTSIEPILTCYVRPNITGKSIYAPGVVDGAIELYEESNWGLNSQTGGGQFCNFDASQSNSRFGLSDSIQPYSAYTFMIIKA